MLKASFRPGNKKASAALRVAAGAGFAVYCLVLSAGPGLAQSAGQTNYKPTGKLEWDKIFPPQGFAGEARRVVRDEPDLKSWAVFFDDQSLFAIHAYPKASPEKALEYVMKTAKELRERMYSEANGIYRGRIDLWRNDLAEGFRDECEYRKLEPGSFKQPWYSTTIWVAVDRWVLMASVGAKYVGNSPDIKEVNSRHLAKMPDALERAIRGLVDALNPPIK
ncbi:MAG: hypothetical protein JW843_11595 [Candidatus Aminicenantes bacterium]|nr:hypothetical protein [Candidatus Aminicenantes bacterium]